MLIQTQADARAALQELANDITHTKTTQVPQIGVSDGGLFGFLGLNSPGSSDVRDSANTLLDQLAGYVLDLYSVLADTDAALTEQQIAKMKLTRSQVVDARAEVQSIISDLDWSFGEILYDGVTIAANFADKAVQAGANALGLNWTVVKIGGAVLLVVLGYAAYRRVRG